MSTTDRPKIQTSQDLDAAQRRANDRLWRRRAGRLVSIYATRTLRPVEVLLLVRYRDTLTGRLLELGSGAGRLSGYLIDLASSFDGMDISPAMVSFCRDRYPRGHFFEGDLRGVGRLASGPYDVIWAPFNILDVLSQGERGSVLDGLGGLLSEDGLLILSTHNRAYAPHLVDPLTLRGSRPRVMLAKAVHLPVWRRNRKRVLPYEHVETDYAVLNDVSHDFKALHYYISRDAQERQLAAHGFSLVECLDLEGHPVPAGASAEDCPELHYVARRTPPA